MPDIFDEVDEDLRADRARALLKRYGGALVAAAVLVVAAAGAWRAWQWYDARQVAAIADIYLAAMQTADTQKGPGRVAAAAQFAQVAADGRSGYRALAQLREAGLKADAGDLAGASALWDRVAGDGAADPLLRDLASLQWAMHNVDSAEPATVAARLAPLTAATGPFHALAEETQAMLDLRQGKITAARTTLAGLAQDVTAPPGVRRRAQGLLARIGS
ncbi:MAG: tetratricopeptide repeat protein [Rhodospirillales bacterium]|nr:tetratricopeptide repeat protein [Rhodospirillales bacterium]